MKALIIGSGISGLTAGAYLARAGHKVIVFEQEKHIGGVTATIEKNGFKWDLGPLLIEKLDEGQELGDILKELGVAGEISTIRSDRGIVFPDFELWAPDRYEGKSWRKEKLKSLFPGDAKGIDKYYRFYEHMMSIVYASNRIRKKERVPINKLMLMAHFLMVKKYQNMNAKELTERFFSDKRLRAVFTGILADFCVLPREFPALGVPLSNIETAFDQRIGRSF